ncbi:MAG: hypothetical protein KA138_06860 [Saprospiraceae bacterium]|nr:hypothetical protein [Saprospiraceae bacterium]
MKRILLFASIALVSLVASCKKDAAPEDPKPEELIVGRWEASSAFIGATDALLPTATQLNELEIEFTASNTVAFHRKTTVLTTTPPGVIEFTLNGVYSFDGNIITITVVSGLDSRTVIGPVDITETHFLFTATSGDTLDFYSKIEADKI